MPCKNQIIPFWTTGALFLLKLRPSIIKLLRNKIISIGLTLGQNKTTSDLIAIYNLIKYEYSSLNDILNEKSNLYNEVKTTYILLGDKILKVLWLKKSYF